MLLRLQFFSVFEFAETICLILWNLFLSKDIKMLDIFLDMILSHECDNEIQIDILKDGS